MGTKWGTIKDAGTLYDIYCRCDGIEWGIPMSGFSNPMTTTPSGKHLAKILPGVSGDGACPVCGFFPWIYEEETE